jgi:hypothetical protein
MLGARATRLLSCEPSSSTAAGSTRPRSSTTILSPEARAARWCIVTTKLLSVIRSCEIKRATQAALGNDAYKRIFDQVKSEKDSSTPPTRIVRGEVVGKVLKPSEGKTAPTKPANLCPHQDSDMIARANKTNKWWTCRTCQSRWERSDLPLMQTGPPKASEVMLAGKYQGKTFREIVKTDPLYDQWVLQTVELGDCVEVQYQRLAKYIIDMEKNMVWVDARTERLSGSDQSDQL